jgi:hypothetical protein
MKQQAVNDRNGIANREDGASVALLKQLPHSFFGSAVFAAKICP